MYVDARLAMKGLQHGREDVGKLLVGFLGVEAGAERQQQEQQKGLFHTWKFYLCFIPWRTTAHQGMKCLRYFIDQVREVADTDLLGRRIAFSVGHSYHLAEHLGAVHHTVEEALRRDIRLRLVIFRRQEL